MSFEPIPEAEMPNVSDAIRNGRCVACYGAIDYQCAEEHNLYCCACDDTNCTERTDR